MFVGCQVIGGLPHVPTALMLTDSSAQPPSSPRFRTYPQVRKAWPRVDPRPVDQHAHGPSSRPLVVGGLRSPYDRLGAGGSEPRGDGTRSDCAWLQGTGHHMTA